MTREQYESFPLATLKELAKTRKMKGTSTLKKQELICAELPYTSSAFPHSSDLRPMETALSSRAIPKKAILSAEESFVFFPSFRGFTAEKRI